MQRLMQLSKVQLKKKKKRIASVPTEAAAINDYQWQVNASIIISFLIARYSLVRFPRIRCDTRTKRDNVEKPYETSLRNLSL